MSLARSFAAVAFAAALSPFAAFAADVINLSSDAFSKGADYYEAGCGTEDTGRGQLANLFQVTGPNDAGDRYMGEQNKAVPNYVAFHFKDAYETGKQIIVNRVYLNVTPYNSHTARVPGSLVVQGSNDPGTNFVAGIGGDLRFSDEGWTDIATFSSVPWSDATDAGKSAYATDLTFDNTASYRYYRIKFTSLTSGKNDWLQLSRLRLYGSALSPNPDGLEATSTSSDTTADITLSCSYFNAADETSSANVYLDYDLDGTFAEGSYTRVTVATGATGDHWSDTVHLSGLFANAVYYARFVVENSAGGSATLPFTFATSKSWYISGTGSDETGDGSAANPFRSFTRVVYDITNQLVTVARPAINVDEGVYSAATGESFPLALPSGTMVYGWSATNAPIDRDARVLDGGNVAATIFRLGQTAFPCRISDLHFQDTRNATPLVLEDTDSTIANCLFTQSLAAPAGDVGAIDAIGVSTVAIDGCDFIGITNRAFAVRVSGANVGTEAPDARKMVVRNCLFADNRLSFTAIGSNGQTANADITVEDTVFSNNVFTSTSNQYNTHFTGCCIGVCGYRVGATSTWFGSLDVNRCQFIGNVGNMVVGAQFLTQGVGGVDGSFVVANSLFADNHPYNAGASAKYTINSYRANANIRGCTFIRNFGGYAAEANVYFYNSILSGEAFPLNPASSKTFMLRNTIFDGCEWGNTAILNGTPIDAVPVFVNAGASALAPGFDARLKPYSPGIDLGDATFAYGATDLAGNARVADNTASGTALPDIGCYESTYGAETVPAFRVPGNGYFSIPRGKGADVEIILANADQVALPVTATVTGPAGWDFPGTLVFTNGSASFACIVPDSAETGVLYPLAVTADGIEPGLLDVNVVDEYIKVIGDNMIVLRSEAGEVSLPVSMATEGLAASSDVAIEIASVSGDGTTTVEWDSDEGHGIARGESQSAAKLVFTPGAGVNSVTLRASADFAESGSDEFTFYISVDPEYFAVDPVNGDDDTAIGTDDLPFRTIDGALHYAVSGDTLKLFPGTHTDGAHAGGTSFPLDAAGITFMGATGNPEDVFIDGTNGVVNIFKRDTSYDSPVVSGVTIGNSTGAIVDLMDASIVFTNCVFRQSLTDNTQAGIGYIYRASRIDMADCVATNLASRFSAFSFDANDADLNASLSRKHDRWLTATRCLFSDCRFERACIASVRPNGTQNDVRLSDCTFSNLRMYINAAGLINGNGANYYYSGVFHLPTGLAQGGEICCWFKADRCRFLSCKGNTLISTSHANAPEFTNCLFADMTNTVSIIWGHYMNGSPKVANCTFVRTSGGFAGGPTDISPATTIVQNSIVDGGEMKTAKLGSVAFIHSLLHDVEYGSYAFTTNVIDETSYTVTTNVAFGANVIFADPLFRNTAPDACDPLFDATLQMSSPAIDAGENTYAAGELDLAGYTRIFHSKVDMGCYECQLASGGTLIMIR